MTFGSPQSPLSFHNAFFSPTESKPTLGTAPQPSKKKLRHCDRQKKEKEALTQQLIQLSKILQLEQAREKEKLATPPRPANPIWQNLARHHFERRLAAEAQRNWLLTTISGKTELIDDLVGVVRQHLKISALIASQSGGQTPELFVVPTDGLLYAMSVQEIKAQYQLTDSVFATSDLNPISSETTQFQCAVTTSDNGIFTQYVRRQHILFTYEQTRETMWMLSHLIHRQEDREDYSAIQDPKNVIATKFRITKMNSDGEWVPIRERLVARKFEEESRTVLVWKATLVGEGTCAGMQTEETGWSIIRPSTTGPGTIVEVCLRQAPLHLQTPNVIPSSAAKQFDSLLSDIIHENSREIMNAAKELLLDIALTGINV